MNRLSFITCLASIFLLTSCAHLFRPQVDTNRLQLGMTKEEAFKILLIGKLIGIAT